jgi:hypothetical protein
MHPAILGHSSLDQEDALKLWERWRLLNNASPHYDMEIVILDLVHLDSAVAKYWKYIYDL